MKTIAIIPARLGSTRFPGKPMANIHGMPMIGHCYYRALLTKQFDEVYVATCDKKIANYIKSIGGTPIMTSKKHKRASTRTAEALKKIEKMTKKKIHLIVMIQGDEPLIPPYVIKKAIKAFNSKEVKISNVMSKFISKKEFENKNNVKVVVNKNNDALYFSREPIPSPWKSFSSKNCFNQTGIIAFTRNALLNFNKLKETSLESLESIDMNRVLETGEDIRMIPTNLKTFGVDTINDLVKVKRLLKNDIVMKKYINL